MISLKSYRTLKKNREFTYIYNKGKKWHCKYAVVFYKQTLEKKVGFVASKKVGNAVNRAFAKRRLRALFLELQEKLKSGNYIFVAKDEIISAPYKELEKNIKWSLRKMECFK